MGPSGSGKSTLINILGLIDRDYEGDYYLNGKNYKKRSDNDLSRIRNDTVGFVFQNFKLIQNNSVFENISIPLLYASYPPSNLQKEVNNVLEKVGLTDKEKMLPNKLSGGQQQRVAIARAIINNPDFIIADEPTGALDSKTSQDIMELFIKLNQNNNTTLIIVTHDKKVAQKADRIINIFDGYIQTDEVLKDD